MSNAELPQPSELDPWQKAMQLSPVLRRFMGDATNITMWQSDVYEKADPLLSKVDKELGSYAGVLVTDIVLHQARNDGVFSQEFDTETQNLLRLVTIELAFIGWQLSDTPELIEKITPSLTKKLTSFPYTQNKRKEKIDSYIQACFNSGKTLKELCQQNNQDTKVESPVAEVQPEENRNESFEASEERSLSAPDVFIHYINNELPDDPPSDLSDEGMLHA